MTDKKPTPGAVHVVRCEPQVNVSNTETEEEEGKKLPCANRTWKTPSLQELEEVLHSAPRSCRHGDEVWPNLYLGDMFMSHDKLGLWQLGVTHVLNASHGKLCCKGSDDFYGTTVKYYGVPANDLPTFDLSPFFYPAAEFIHQALTSGGKVLVHCIMGMSRSATLVLVYLMLRQRLTLRDALRHVIKKRAIYPNQNFLSLLLKLDERLTFKRRICPLL
ncbi:Dual specificity protein phosphatase 13 isoform A [Collichthys lucidus]|uniref:Dual specificity protein phosphatase n=1 Tax=Collichthys lucidus TaxID=240159 RepID=A0A4U5VC36_COLLU|nr:Dual specificity protein phosphatase 13 isoform A [Collichthys lucidus]